MPVDVTVPDLGESISEVEVSAWLKQPGETVALDEPVIELESDKATVEVPAPAAGVVKEIVAEVGDVLKIGDVLARIEEGASGDDDGGKAEKEDAADDSGKDEPEAEEKNEKEKKEEKTEEETENPDGKRVMPAARRAMAERGVSADEVAGSGPGGRVLKEDVPAAPRAGAAGDDRSETRRRMSPIRRRIAERLVASQQEAALLTTFNEIDMSRVKALRAEHQEAFTAKYGTKLGFMSFFVKAVVEAVGVVPELNARIEDEEIVQPAYCDVGIAVGGGKGLVVPVIRNAESLDFGQLEQTIADFAERAQANKIDLAELEGGTFTISNGGVYGSLLSTPIINPPQSGVLGLHAIEDRPVVVDGEIVIRSMMYVALTYDHRLVDGREAVTFLKQVKLCVEQPERLLLKV
jgi:2-oxoglutarate dehydrogenase E2 component (dihydrolipoamide succinyltransferase)